MLANELRVCKECGIARPLTREFFGSTPSGGFRHKCRECMRVYVRQYDNATSERKQAASQRAGRRSHLALPDRDKHAQLLRIRDGNRCFYCHIPLSYVFHVDHKTPVVRGGTNALENLVLTCVQCNQEKHNKTVPEYAAWKRLNRLPVVF